MGFIVITVILAVALVISIGAAFFTTGGKIAIPVVIVAFFVALMAFSATTVSARSVGIETGFGKYKNTLDNGFHWTNPTSSVEEFSTQIQTLRLDGSKDGVGGTAVNYRGGGRGVIDATVAWKISDKQAQALWERFKSFDNVRDQLVTAASQAAIRETVGQKAPTDAQAGNNLEPMAGDIKAKLATAFAPYGVEVDSVRITAVILDEKTQQSIEKVVAAQQDIERAKADRERAKIDAETAEIRAKSGTLSAGGLQRYCLEVMNAWDVNKNGPLPAGFNCFSGSNVGLVTPTK